MPVFSSFLFSRRLPPLSSRPQMAHGERRERVSRCPDCENLPRAPGHPGCRAVLRARVRRPKKGGGAVCVEPRLFVHAPRARKHVHLERRERLARIFTTNASGRTRTSAGARPRSPDRGKRGTARLCGSSRSRTRRTGTRGRTEARRAAPGPSKPRSARTAASRSRPSAPSRRSRRAPPPLRTRGGTGN
jgi:hypothetical protein